MTHRWSIRPARWPRSDYLTETLGLPFESAVGAASVRPSKNPTVRPSDHLPSSRPSVSPFILPTICTSVRPKIQLFVQLSARNGRSLYFLEDYRERKNLRKHSMRNILLMRRRASQMILRQDCTTNQNKV